MADTPSNFNALNEFLSILDDATTKTREMCVKHNLNPSTDIDAVLLAIGFDTAVELRKQINDAKALTSKVDILETQLHTEHSTCERLQAAILEIRTAAHQAGCEAALTGTIKAIIDHIRNSREYINGLRGLDRHNAKLLASVIDDNEKLRDMSPRGLLAHLRGLRDAQPLHSAARRSMNVVCDRLDVALSEMRQATRETTPDGSPIFTNFDRSRS